MLRLRESQTFHLWFPRDFLDKLHWEVQGLCATRRLGPDETAWRTFNVAVTAWHMCDWVYDACHADKATRARLENIADRKIAKVEHVRAWARKDRAIAICRLIATASKHVKVTSYPDPSVRARLNFDRDSGADLRSRLVIEDGDEVLRPSDLARRADKFWTLALKWLELD